MLRSSSGKVLTYEEEQRCPLGGTALTQEFLFGTFCSVSLRLPSLRFLSWFCSSPGLQAVADAQALLE